VASVGRDLEDQLAQAPHHGAVADQVELVALSLRMRLTFTNWPNDSAFLTSTSMMSGVKGLSR